MGHGHLPPLPGSPVMSHGHLPPSPIIHSSQQIPSSPDRYTSAEAKVVKQLINAMTKMQNSMKDLAERQEQILDRMSLLEQRVGRMDDGVSRIVENTDIALEAGKTILTRVNDNENLDGFEARLNDLMNSTVDRLVGGIGEEIKAIKKAVKNTEEQQRRLQRLQDDPFSWSNSKEAMAQRVKDACSIAEEEQKEISDV